MFVSAEQRPSIREMTATDPEQGESLGGGCMPPETTSYSEGGGQHGLFHSSHDTSVEGGGGVQMTSRTIAIKLHSNHFQHP